MNFHQVIYINGERRRCTGIGPHFYVDSDSHPGVPCSQHSLTQAACRHLEKGGAVRTSGNSYSLNAPKEQA